MNSDNRGYSLAVVNGNNNDRQEKVYLKPMALYIPAMAEQALAELVAPLSSDNVQRKGFIVSVTNNNNGVSVDKEFASLDELQVPGAAADAVKDLINIVRGYESDEETNVCGW
ncbi:DUF1869 domain-containing protein [Klebsiella sp. B345]|uniref:DUF1869 domain-containing protein n=1 Tax=Klebsiella sp. B345 TaxID=2755398 RepID=UPI003DA85C40